MKMKWLKNILNRNIAVLDTNVILRYLLEDNEEMTQQSKFIITNYNCKVYLEVICEVVYVLQGLYSVDRANIKNSIFQLSKDVDIDKLDILSIALDEFCNKPKKDFVDCLLYGYHKKGYSVFTFDKKLQKLL